MMILMSSIVIMLLMMFQFSVSNSMLVSDPQLFSLEAGFETLKQSSLISSSFFMLAVLFVLFDMELVLMFPGILFFPKNIFFNIIVILLLISVVILSLMVEWIWCGLKWSF